MGDLGPTVLSVPLAAGDEWPDGVQPWSDRGTPVRLEFIYAGETDARELVLGSARAGVAREALALDVLAEVLDGWRLRARLEVLDYGPEVTEVHLTRQADGQRVGRNVLRRLGLSQVMDETSSLLRDPMVTRRVGEPWTTRVRRPGRGGTTDAEYLLVAIRYLRALAVDDRAPYRVMLADPEAQYGETSQSLRSAVHRARTKAKVLAEAPGRELTGKGRSLAARLGLEVPK